MIIKDFKVVDTKTIELKHDAHAGDQIDLSAISQLNLDDIQERISDKTAKEKQKEIEVLTAQLKAEHGKELLQASEVAALKAKAELQDKINKLEQEIQKHESSKDKAVLEKEKELQAKIHDADNKISKLENDIKSVAENAKVAEANLKLSHSEALKSKDTEISLLRDMRFGQSTKMIGESLEQHCEIEFEKKGRIMFPGAVFGKDNDSSSGSKGDYIYREIVDGIEALSIMFEMKNEHDTTATKKKNKDFFKELDKDRNEKKCEFAVLVSLLEKENDLYMGITNVYEYEKMFVIRPQCFLEIINFLRLGIAKNLELKKEIALIKDRNVDVASFDQAFGDFKNNFGRNYTLANTKFTEAIEGIDKQITGLQKIKENLLGADRNLRLANDKLESVNIKKLAKNSPSILEEIKNQGNE
ncbi:MAG: DUF2130 domain-containing protein [Mycoplasmataceae bacterium]|jgi:hypothetical protein|nr:DUF2130 domain-containing protein [Mycoplasmataceae bacterium]